jgi:hypothetical protein
MRRTTLRTAASLIAAAAIAGCGDSGGPSNDALVNFSLATKPSPAAAASPMAFVTAGTSETYTDGVNTLVIDQVQLVLREIELKRSEATGDCGEPQGEAHDCEELEFGPLLLDLPLGGAGGAARSFSVNVAAGTFNEIEFKIHAPSGGEDAAFVQANPEFAGVSVKVTGTYNGQPFTYVSGLEAEESIELSPPIVTSESAATDLTLFADLDRWFRDDTGNLVDPASANAGNPNQALVENNIQTTLHAFEDGDHDGWDDHGGTDGGV